MAKGAKAPPVKTVPRKRRTLKRSLPKPPGDGWWGKGPPPWERWPDVTLDLESVWNATHENAAGEKVGRWESPDGLYYFDQETADKAVDFFPELLTHPRGEFAGKPFHLLPYQELLLTRPLFGWKRVSDGTRRFRKVIAMIPKGNGKSPWAAGTGLYLMECDDEPGAEVYALAGDKEQARVVHNDAKTFVEDSQELENNCQILKDAIFDGTTRSKFQVLSTDASTKHGFRPHGVILDEFHNQRDRDLFEALDKSMAKRVQPVMIIISHAGDDDEGICFEELELAKLVLSGTHRNDSILPVVFEAKPTEDWTDEKTWARVNPALGILIKIDALRTACNDALIQPRKRNDFLRFHLNRWVSTAVAWLSVDDWDANELEAPDAALQLLPIAAGLDLSQKFDLTAFVVAFLEFLTEEAKDVEVVTTEMDKPIRKTVSLNYRIHLRPYFWLPADTLIERTRQDRVQYDIWRDEGYLRVTEGNIVDYSAVLDDITGPIARRFPRLKGAQIGYDPAFATDIALRLNDRGYTAVEILQNYQHLSEPAHIVEALLKARRLNHDGNPLLRWNAENVAIKRDDAGRIRPVKPRNQAKRIDGIVAAAMAVSRLTLQHQPVRAYSATRGLRTL